MASGMHDHAERRRSWTGATELMRENVDVALAFSRAPDDPPVVVNNGKRHGAKRWC
ncbi:hypothetical protein BN2475_50167 [Paraburkholderia ribeironis]|uniref:Uncharacterized protein n=1 Tax=Paraburkholderia ribeironis TaxID=1247936 RepID=A0A1N7RLV9_9BURK|nr:hypothetical protein BN2475_50167 [Paraburkholderia ribeironis]